MRGTECHLHIFSGTRARIDETGGVQPGQGRAVERNAAALRDHGLRPIEAEPAQVLDHGGHELWPAAGGVEVVVAQEQRAADGAGAFLDSPEGPGMAEMEQAGR